MRCHSAFFNVYFSFHSGYPVAVETVVFPSTADDALQQYVCLTLVVELTPGYPDVAPDILLRNPRGLDDSVLGRIDREVKEKCESYRGQAVIYELIEVCSRSVIFQLFVY